MMALAGPALALQALEDRRKQEGRTGRVVWNPVREGQF